jgi:hypothetical protein
MVHLALQAATEEYDGTLGLQHPGGLNTAREV